MQELRNEKFDDGLKPQMACSRSHFDRDLASKLKGSSRSNIPSLSEGANRSSGATDSFLDNTSVIMHTVDGEYFAFMSLKSHVNLGHFLCPPYKITANI